MLERFISGHRRPGVIGRLRGTFPMRSASQGRAAPQALCGSSIIRAAVWERQQPLRRTFLAGGWSSYQVGGRPRVSEKYESKR
jgi:hypothetical protein